MAFGYQFQPGVGRDLGMERGRGGPQQPLQEAIQMLSLRLPKGFGAQSIAPAQLLTGLGGMGQPGAKGNVTAQALAMMAGVPMGPMPSAPSMPSVPTLPSEQEDRERGVFRTLPRPAPRDPGGAIPSEPTPPPLAIPSPSIRPGRETGEGPRQGGDLEDLFRFVERPQPPPDPYEELRYILGLPGNRYQR